MLCGSIGPDPCGKRIAGFLQAAKKVEVTVALEGPRLAAWEPGERRCKRASVRTGILGWLTSSAKGSLGGGGA